MSSKPPASDHPPVPDELPGDDHLSQHLNSAAWNIRCVLTRKPEFLQRFGSVLELLKGQEGEAKAFSRHPLLPIFHNTAMDNFLGSVRLALAGQPVVAMPTARAALESALYATFTANDEHKMRLWLNRATSVDARKEMNKVFRAKDAINHLRKSDQDLGDRACELYDSLIDFGAHPNVEGALNRVAEIDEEGGLFVHELTPPTEMIYATGLAAVHSTGVIAFSIFQHTIDLVLHDPA